MQIIIKKKGTEKERKKAETSAQILKHYYTRECRDGSRFRSKATASKDVIKKLYAVR